MFLHMKLNETGVINMSYLDHVLACNNLEISRYLPFVIDDIPLGLIRRDKIDILKKFNQTFVISADYVTLLNELDDFENRSTSVAQVVEKLSSENEIPIPRREMYPISRDIHYPPLMQIERVACPFFGFRTFGVHMNGFVRQTDGIYMWIARRAWNKSTYPGMLDNMVAGGQPLGLGLKENLIKECGEEAGIPIEISRNVRPVGVIMYDHQSAEGAKPDCQYCYDLELTENFRPVAVDGEVQEFMLWPLHQVAEKVNDTLEFKFNCNLVIIDFLIRHGYLDPDNEVDYIDICRGLRKESVI